MMRIVQDLQTTRKVSLSLLLICIQIIIIAAFGARWSSGKWIISNYAGMAPPYAVLIPWPNGAPWWLAVTSILMYLTLAVVAVYLLWTVAQILVPERITLDLKMVVFLDVVFAGILTILLLLAYCFYAGGFSNAYYRNNLGFGYCFWLAVAASIGTVITLIIAGLGWFKN